MMNNERMLRICYFGVAEQDFSRNRVFLEGLRTRKDVQIVECTDRSPGLHKYIRLWQMHRPLRHTYDVMLVGYPGQSCVWLAKLISSGPIIVDTISSLYEGEIISRHPEKRRSWLAAKIWALDFVAYHLADMVCVESQAQVRFFEHLFYISPKKCRSLFTGADDKVFNYDPQIKKHENFTVLFRGAFLPEAGIRHVLEAALLLKDEPIDFRIYGKGRELPLVENFLHRHTLPHLMLDTQKYPLAALPAIMSKCHVSLGQLAQHERLERTIPHKAFESAALRLPYISAGYPAIRELLSEGESAVMISPGNSQELADAIMDLYRHPDRASRLADGAYRAYHEKASQEILCNRLIAIVRECHEVRRS